MNKEDIHIGKFYLAKSGNKIDTFPIGIKDKKYWCVEIDEYGDTNGRFKFIGDDGLIKGHNGGEKHYKTHNYWWISYDCIVREINENDILAYMI